MRLGGVSYSSFLLEGSNHHLNEFGTYVQKANHETRRSILQFIPVGFGKGSNHRLNEFGAYVYKYKNHFMK